TQNLCANATFFISSRRRHTRSKRDWSSDVCSSDLQGIVAGLPLWRNPLPWKNTPETPNIGTWAQTDDMRPGLGWDGLAHLERFVDRKSVGEGKGGDLGGCDINISKTRRGIKTETTT